MKDSIAGMKDVVIFVKYNATVEAIFVKFLMRLFHF